ncbi:MAG: hypothetical protein R2813_08035 [Flavobacteriales bacterium]
MKKPRDFFGKVMFMQLVDFQKEISTLEGFSKGRIVNYVTGFTKQRRRNRAKKLNLLKRNKLDSIGLIGKSEEFREETDYDDIWWDSYVKLEAYKRGEWEFLTYHARYKKDKPLGTWVVCSKGQKKKK